MSMRIKALAMALAATGAIAATVVVSQHAIAGGNPNVDAVVYVTSQDLFFDSIVLGDLPQKGPFQLLEMTGPSGLQTEFGPGDAGYLGGRWWVDVNGDGEMDDGDNFFLCPLLPPGRDEP